MFRSNWFRRVTVALLIPSLGGCAGWHPYKLAPSLDDDAESEVTLTAGSKEPKLAYAVSLNQAFAAANEQRNLYLDRVNENHALRSSASVMLYALSAWVVYKGVVTDSASSRRNIALGTATGAATYAFGNWFTNPQQEAAYLQGFRGITCAMWQVRPYLVPAGDYSQFLENRTNLKERLKELDSAYEKLRLAERQFREAGNDSDLSKIGTDFRLAERTRRRAHSTLDKADRFATRVDSAGFTLRRRVELIAATVNEEVQRTSPDLKAIDTLVNQFASQITSNAQALKADPLDLKDDDENDKTGDGGTGATGDSNGSQPAPAANSAGGALDRQIVSLNSKIAALEKRLQAASVKSSKNTEQTLKKMRTDLDALKKKAPAVLPTVEQKKESASEALSESVRNNTISYFKSFNFPDQREGLMSARVSVWDALGAVESELNQAAARRVGRNVAQCRDTTAPLLVVSPADDQVVMSVKSQMKFTVKGGEGVPRAFLTGDKGTGKTEVSMTTTADNGLVTVILTTADNQVPEGTATLLVTDGSGKQSEEVRIAFKQPPKADKPKTTGNSPLPKDTADKK